MLRHDINTRNYFAKADLQIKEGALQKKKKERRSTLMALLSHAEVEDMSHHNVLQVALEEIQ